MKILIGIYVVVCLLLIDLAFQAGWLAGMVTIILIIVFGFAWSYFAGKKV